MRLIAPISATKLAVHSFRKHGTRPELGGFLQGDSCGSCLLRFSHRPALRDHVLNKNKLCRNWYSQFGKLVDAKVVEAESEEDRGMKSGSLKKGRARFMVHRPCGQLESFTIWCGQKESLSF